MKDCRLLATIRNDQLHFEAQDVSLEGLANMAGFLQIFAGCESLKQGLDIDDIKGNMLDIHLAAMEAVEAQMGKWRQEEAQKGGTDEDSI